VPIGKHQRRSEAELWSEFEIAQPHILGALLDAQQYCVCARCLTSLPRMADFALWATPCEPGCGLRAPLHAAMTRTAEPQLGGTEADPVAVCALFAEPKTWPARWQNASGEKQSLCQEEVMIIFVFRVKAWRGIRVPGASLRLAPYIGKEEGQLGHPLTGTAAAVRLEALARFCNAGRPAGISARRRKRNRLSGRGAYGLGMGDTRNTNDIA
jgi:hypothetical protein